MSILELYFYKMSEFMGKILSCLCDSFTQREERKRSPSLTDQINLGGIIGFIFTMALMYFLLLGPNHSILSLGSILNWVSHLSSGEQLLIISLIPVYLSLLIFGGGAIGAMSGHYIEKLLRKKG